MNNYDELMSLWDWSPGRLKDTDMKASVRGGQAMIISTSFSVVH